MLVFTCTDDDQSTANNLGGNAYPTCSSGGAWVQVEAYSGAEFDPSTFDQAKAAAAMGAGFSLMGTGMCIAWAVAVLVNRVTRRG